MNAIPQILARARHQRVTPFGVTILGALVSSGLTGIVVLTCAMAPDWAPLPIMLLGTSISITALAWLCSDCHEGER